MNSDDSALRITRHTADGALSLGDELRSVYLASHQDQQGNPWYSPEMFWERLETLYAPMPGFELVTGWVDDHVAGYAFGTPHSRPDAVWDTATNAIPELSRTQPGTVFFFREFSVHPDYQGRGYARVIHNALLAARTEALAFLLVRRGNPAKNAYEAWGWRTIGQQQPFADAPIMDEMATVVQHTP